jgi:predicted peptidase
MNSQVLVFTPENYDSQKSLPLMIFLHGSGERGTDINLVKKHGPPKIAEKDKHFEFITVSPQCLKDAKGKGWWEVDDLNLLLDYVQKNYKVDKSRIYLTGLSMGGFGSWAWVANNPDIFAAVVPICGGGDPKNAKKYGKLPIWAFHGDKDTAVPLKKSQEMVDAINKVDGDIKLTIYPGVGHDSWTETYKNPDVYKWLLSHKK